MEARRIVNEKYLDTDIDSIVIHFDDTKEESFVSEFEVPEEHKYIIMISKNEKREHPDWVEIVNPEAIAAEDNPVLPDLEDVSYNGKSYTFMEFIKFCTNQ